MRNLSRILWGIVLVIVGVIWGIDALGIMEINLFFDGWWTLFIIVPCVIGLFDTTNHGKTGDVIGICIGVILLLAAQNVFSFDLVWKLLFPVIIVIIGISLIFSNSIKTKVKEKIATTNEKDLENIVATFGSQNIERNGKEFKGANIDCVFGGIKLDLSKAELKEETVIKASSIFGGIDIIVPKDVEVIVKATPIFGGVSNTTKNNEAKKTIYVDAFCLFGGVEIK